MMAALPHHSAVISTFTLECWIVATTYTATSLYCCSVVYARGSLQESWGASVRFTVAPHFSNIFRAGKIVKHISRNRTTFPKSENLRRFSEKIFSHKKRDKMFFGKSWSSQEDFRRTYRRLAIFCHLGEKSTRVQLLGRHAADGSGKNKKQHQGGPGMRDTHPDGTSS